MEIKNAPERKATHTGYGLGRAAAISVLCFFGLSALIGGGETAWLLLILIPLIVTMFLLPPIMLILGIVTAIRQLCLDKKLGGVLGILLNLAMPALYIALIPTGLHKTPCCAVGKSKACVNFSNKGQAFYAIAG